MRAIGRQAAFWAGRGARTGRVAALSLRINCSSMVPQNMVAGTRMKSSTKPAVPTAMRSWARLSSLARLTPHVKNLGAPPRRPPKRALLREHRETVPFAVLAPASAETYLYR